MFMQKFHDAVKRLDEYRHADEREIRDLGYRLAQAEKKQQQTEKTLSAILDFLGVDWQIPGPAKLVRKGGPECAP